jgi:DNA-binding response OmpR family regulator
VLVLEDYPPLAKVIEIGLRRIGHEAVRVENARQALAIEGEFELATMDLDLPDGKGVDVAQQLIDDGRLRRVVFFSATHDVALEARARNLGPFVDKSYGVEALLSVITKLLAMDDAMAKAVGAPDTPTTGSRHTSGTRRRVR